MPLAGMTPGSLGMLASVSERRDRKVHMLNVKWAAALSCIAVCVILLVGAQVTHASDDLESLRQEIESLKTGQQAIQKELVEIKQLLQGPRRKPAVEAIDLRLSLDGAPVKGDPQAPLILMEFSDYECPFCARHFQTTWPQIAQHYIRTGKLRYVFRDFPLEAIHRHAVKAAEAAHCAGEQGRYWSMHDRLFAHRTALGAEKLPHHAEAVGLVLPEFQACLDSGRYADQVRQGFADGKKAGVRGTPTFFVGIIGDQRRTISATRVIRGAVPFAEFQKVLEHLLAELDETK